MTTLMEPQATAKDFAPSDPPVGGGSLLLIEDNPIDALRTMALIRTKVPDMHCRHVTTLADATPELLAAADCVLLDLGLPDAHDQEGLKEILQRATEVPVVVLTGNDDPLNTGLESLRNGAQDFLAKGAIDGAALERSIRYAIERKSFQAHLAAAALLSAAAALVAETEAASAAVITTTAQGGVKAAAAAAARAAAAAITAVDLSVATAAADAAGEAALAAVVGAAEVRSTARAAAKAAADAATTAATALAAEATASAAAADGAVKLLAARVEHGAAVTSGIASAIATRLATVALGVPDQHYDDPAGRNAAAAEVDAGARSAVVEGRDTFAAPRSTGARAAILTAKLVVATAIMLTLLLILTAKSAS